MRDETTLLYSPTTDSISEVNPTITTSSSMSNPPALSTILTTQRIDDHTVSQTSATAKIKISDPTATLPTTTRSTGNN